MESPDHAFWDELGVAWRATISDKGLFSAQLERRLRRQNAALKVGFGVAAAAALLGLGLGAWTLWFGWSSGTWNFVSRGATLIAAAALALFAAIRLRGETGREAISVRESLQQSIARTDLLIRSTTLAVGALVVLGLGGLVGSVIRARFGRPAHVSPIEDLLALAVVGLALLWFRWSQSRSLEAARRVSRALDSPE